MTARFRPLIFLCIAALLSACASSPSSTLGELPRTPQASTQQLLKDADASDPGKAALLRLSAADQSIQHDNLTQARQILEQVAIDQLMPAQQMFAKTLEAELALAAGKPESALQALQHPAFERLAELPVEQQLRTQLARAEAFEANNQPLDAARERTFIAPLLSGEAAEHNHETIWSLVSISRRSNCNRPPTPTSQAGYRWLPPSNRPARSSSKNAPSRPGSSKTQITQPHGACPTRC